MSGSGLGDAVGVHLVARKRLKDKDLIGDQTRFQGSGSLQPALECHRADGRAAEA